MINYEKKFDEYYITQNMKDYNMTRASAKVKLENLKKLHPTMYKMMVDNYFDEVHPFQEIE